MKRFSLNKKIMGILSIFVLACTVISAIGIEQVGEINASIDKLIHGVVARQAGVLKADYLIAEIKNQEKKFILQESVDGMHKVGEVIENLEGEVEALLVELHKISTPSTKVLYEDIDKRFAEWEPINAEVRKLALEGRLREAFAIANGVSAVKLREIDHITDQLTIMAKETMAKESARTNELVAHTRMVILSVSTISLAIGLFLAFMIMRSVNRQINQVIDSLDESSNQVASAAQQIASSSQELSQSTTTQASSLEETAASVEEMNSMINKNSENARQTSETANRSQQDAQKGQQTVELMIRSINDINDANTNIMKQINHSNTQISEIVQVIAEIGNKTKVINDIVFQTKLLSFNASVEAARAGEHGRGFAVVAEEVGKLAEMSGNAAKEISTMLDGSIAKVQGIVNDTKSSVERMVSEGKEKVDNGTRIANDCGQVLNEIVLSISSVTQMSGEISSASQEQAQGIGEITKAMVQLDQVTQQNSSTSREAASAAEKLSVQADNLKAGVAVLMETIRGTSDPTIHTATIAQLGTKPARSEKAHPLNLESNSAA